MKKGIASNYGIALDDRTKAQVVRVEGRLG